MKLQFVEKPVSCRPSRKWLVFS